MGRARIVVAHRITTTHGAPAIQTTGATDMGYCNLCIPCLHRIGVRLAYPLPPRPASIPFATTVATVGAIIVSVWLATIISGSVISNTSGRLDRLGIRSCSAAAFDFGVAVIATSGFRSCIAVVKTAAFDNAIASLVFRRHPRPYAAEPGGLHAMQTRPAQEPCDGVDAFRSCVINFTGTTADAAIVQA